MDKSQMRIRPGFVIGLLIVFVVIPWLFQIVIFAPRISDKTKAQIIVTRFETKTVASALKQRAVSTGSLTNIDGAFILQALFGTNTFLNSYRTNANGEFLDAWQTPYKIEILSQTNFIIRSAGKDKIFGDADDIIFNSVSNDFVKP
jgi:hypothetical protein